MQDLYFMYSDIEGTLMQNDKGASPQKIVAALWGIGYDESTD